ncbi:MAG TPA: TonB-dependent receptor [Bacteroidia bacterium]|nr:TonB-dependent receptor [Bacteroidia bacterium]
MGIKKLSFVFFLICAACSPLFSQQTFVSGMVKDSATDEALIGVVISNGTVGTVTDVDGKYTLKVEPGTQTISFHYIGYREEKREITAVSGTTDTLDVILVDVSRTMNIVVISSGRYEQNIGEVPVSMEVLKPKLIDNKGTTNMENIMDQVPGVSMTDGQANIRGGSGYSYGSGSRVLLVVDDMPMLSGDAGDVKWNYLPIENVSQVEVMKGASSAVFGSSALNGVIHFRTAYPTDKPQTTISLINGFYGDPKRDSLRWWGNNNPTFSGINFSHMRQIGNLDLVIGGHLYNDEGYRYLETEQRERLNVNLRYRCKKIQGLSFGVNTNMMQTRGGLFILWYDEHYAYTPADSTLQKYNNHRFNIDPYITYFSPKGFRHTIRTRYYQTTNKNDTKQGAIAGFLYGEYQFQYKFKCGVTVTSGLVSSRAVVAADLYPGTNAAEPTPLGNLLFGSGVSHNSANMSAYAQFDKRFFDRLFVTFGVRGEYYRLDTIATQYDLIHKGDTLLTLPFRPVIRVGVNYQAGEATFLRISYGQGYRFPCIAEKFIRTDASGLEIYPNSGLKPESGQSAEIGIKQGVVLGAKWKGFADASIYWMQYHDMMEFAFGQWGGLFTDPNFGFGFKSVNIGSTRIRGVDVSFMGQGKIGVLDVSVLAGYTYMDPVSLIWNEQRDTNIATPGAGTAYYNVLKYRYRHLAKFDGEVGYKKFTLGASMRYNSFMENIDKVFVDPVVAHTLPGIANYRARFNKGDLVFDARLMYQVNDNVRVNFLVNNFLNREVSSRPADVQPPRNFAFQVTVKF